MPARARAGARSAATRRGRKRGQTSPRIRAAARAAGKQGGRPREQLPEELLAQLGEPPTDPLKKAVWWGRLLEVVTLGLIQGRQWGELNDRVRQNTAIAAKLLPDEIKQKALELLERDEDERSDDDVSPAETRFEDGDARNGAPALRRNPS